MKVAVIGAGRWGKNLVKGFADLSALGAIVDAEEKTRSHWKAVYPELPIFKDLNELPSKMVSALAIATPVSTHHALAVSALAKGFDVYLEKPMTASHAEALDLAEKLSHTDRILMVGHLLLYQPAIRWIAQQLKEGMIGKLLSVHQERLNLGTARSLENALWSLGCHDVAVLNHLISENPSDVKSLGDGFTPESDMYLHLTYPSGVTAHLHVSWRWPEKRRQLTLIGEKGMLVFDEITGKVFLHKKWIGEKLENKDDGSACVFQSSEPPLGFELKHFLDCVKHRRTPLSDIRNGVAVIEVLEKASVR